MAFVINAISTDNCSAHNPSKPIKNKSENWHSVCLVVHVQNHLNNSSLLFLYLIGLLFLGLYSVRKKEKQRDDYSLGNGKFGWLMIAFSLFLSNIIRIQIIGYSLFIPSFLGWFLLSIALLVAGNLLGIFLNKQFHTPVLLLNSSAGNRILAFAGICFYVAIQLLSILFISAILLEQVAGVDYYSSAVMIVAISGIFVVVGGQLSLMRTQSIQLLFVLGALGLTFVRGIDPFGIVTRGMALQVTPSTNNISTIGAILGIPLLSFWFWNIDYYSLHQLALGKNIREKNSALIVALMFTAAIVFFVSTASIPRLPFTEEPRSITQSPFVNGVLVAGVGSLLLVALAVTFSSTSSLFTNGIYRSIKSSATDGELILIGRLAAMSVSVATILLIPFAKTVGGFLLPYFFLFPVYFCTPIMSLSFIKKVWMNGSGNADLYALLAGELIGLILFCDNIFPDILPGNGYFSQIDPFLAAVISVFFTGIVYVVLNLVNVRRVSDTVDDSVTVQ